MKTKRSAFFAVLLCWLSLSSPCLGTTYHVYPDGTGDFPTIQTAIDAATAGDLIVLGNGVFRGPGNRNIYVTKAVHLSSASGDPQACIIDCEGGPSSPGKGFFVGAAGFDQPSLEGLTIAHGYVEDSSGGGAVSCFGDATFGSCVFLGNIAAAGEGGAVMCLECSPIFSACLFEGNTANQSIGGAVAVLGAGTALFEHCVFRGNRAMNGGACGLVYFGSGEFESCVFDANHGGAMCCLDNARADLSGCTITNNVAAGLASGFRLELGSSVSLENSIVAFGLGGTAILCRDGSGTTLACCDVFGNEGGDWVGCLEGQGDMDGNLSADPLFCGNSEGDFRLNAASPCAPQLAPNCGLIGALPVGCGETTPAVQVSWGCVKRLFR